MSRFEVVLVQDGMEYVTARTRRLAGAENEAAAIAANTRANLLVHAEPGERVIEGPTEAGDYAVLRLAADGTLAAYREIVIRQLCGRGHPPTAMKRVCGGGRCGLCYERELLAAHDRARPQPPMELVYDPVRHMNVMRRVKKALDLSPG